MPVEKVKLEDIREKYISGMNMREIGSYYGVTYQAVADRLKRAGVPRRGRGAPVSKERIKAESLLNDDLLRYLKHDLKLTNKQIAERIKVPAQTVGSIAVKRGILYEPSKEDKYHIARPNGVKQIFNTPAKQEKLKADIKKYYYELGLSVNDTAEKVGVSWRTVLRWMNYWNMERRSRNMIFPYLDKAQKQELKANIKRMYLKERMTTFEVAEKLNTTASTIGRWMDIFGIKKRGNRKRAIK